jgi:hypothetical protein
MDGQENRHQALCLLAFPRFCKMRYDEKRFSPSHLIEKKRTVVRSYEQ